MAILRPCTTSAGFMVTPDQQTRLRLDELKQALADDGYQIIIDAHVLLVVRKNVESSIYDTGKVILKTIDKPAAESAYADLESKLAAVTS